MSVGEKIKAVRKARGLTLAEMAASLGVKSTGHLSQIERNQVEASISFLNHFKLAFSVSEQWWNSGTGEMFEEKKEPHSVVREAAGGEYNGIDPLDAAFLRDWKALGDVEQMRFWTLLKEAIRAEKEKGRS